jgi:hypothetical protein
MRILNSLRSTADASSQYLNEKIATRLTKAQAMTTLMKSAGEFALAASKDAKSMEDIAKIMEQLADL